MDIQTIIIIAGIMLTACTIQSAVGFGYGLFATPLLISIGITLPEAIAIVATCSLVQAIIGSRHLHAVVPWRLSITASSIRLVTTILGMLILKEITSLKVSDVKFIVGCILCFAVGLQFFGKKKPSKTIHWAWDGLAFAASGLLAGVCGMGGPPLVFWLMAHDWSVEKTRGFLFSIFAISLPFLLILLYITFGTDILWNIGLALLLSPAVFVGALIGLPLGNRMPKHIMRIIVYLILLSIGLNSIIPALAQHLGY
ncbi:MAG: sulfite exporter TauE/SafE family protein [Kiritimatiellae bacterium]|nr:sulfite exporter TauE/SafE family protein [Kiritimatiellia bacterium]